MKTFFVTSCFGSLQYYHAASRLISQATFLHPLIDETIVVNNEFASKFIKNELATCDKSLRQNFYKSFIWKPLILNYIMSKVAYDDVVFYLDCGCELSNSPSAYQQFEYLLEKCIQDSFVLFELPQKQRQYTGDTSLNCLETKYNLECRDEDKQVAGGVLFFRKSQASINLVEEWAYIAYNDHIDAFISKDEPMHRHDQSVLSALVNTKSLRVNPFAIWQPIWGYAYSSSTLNLIHTPRNKSQISFLRIHSYLSSRIFAFLKSSVLMRIYVLWIFKLIKFASSLFNLIDLSVVSTSFFEGDDQKNPYLVDSYRDVLIYDLNTIYLPRLKAHSFRYKTIHGLDTNKLKQVMTLVQSKDKVISVDSCFLLTSFNGDNIYHFVFENLLPYLRLTQANKAFAVQPIIISPLIGKLFGGFLSIHGINYIVLPKSYRLLTQKIYCLRLTRGYRVNIDHLQLLFNFIQKVSLLITNSENSRLFINRRRTDGRMIYLTTVHKSILEQNGFTIVYLEDLTADQQICFMASATKIICSHGAALSFAYFNIYRTKIIHEFFPETITNLCYYELSLSLNWKHSFSHLPARFNKYRPTDADMIMSCKELKNALNSFA